MRNKKWIKFGVGFSSLSYPINPTRFFRLCAGVSQPYSVISLFICGVCLIAFSWLSQYDADPGMTQQTFDTIKMKIDSGVDDWAYKLCCLHVDEMEIKKHVDYNRHTDRIHGFTDIGNGPLDGPSQPQATKVLAVVAVGLLGHWKLPLGYYLTT